MYQYRITKYNPDLRSTGGTYAIDEWTSRSDIGKTFGGVLLTEDSYLTVERAYLEAAAAFLGEASVTGLTVVGLENSGQNVFQTQEGSHIKAEDIPAVLRSLLREELWCKLECPSAFVHIGYDFYMYIGAPVKCTNASAIAQSIGLFVEELKSPYS